MSKHRKIQEIIQPMSVVEGAGVRLQRSFPSRAADNFDPFLLFDDFSSGSPADYRRGFPWHPHRGIETVTYVLAGVVHHRDSIGNAGSIGAGDAQWMTSGSGIMHEEMPDPDHAPLTGFQLWVNLPAKQKMSVPRYRDITAAAIPRVELGPGAFARVVAGEVAGVRGPAEELTIAPTYLDVELEPGASAAHAVGAEDTALAYLFGGEAAFGADGSDGQQTLAKPGLVVFGAGEQIDVRATDPGARYLLMLGRPLHEPIARHGPFVMNTRAEIEEALRDLQQGTFIRADRVVR